MKIRSHFESHIVELDDGSRWQIFPGDLDLTLDWKPETELAVVSIEDEVSSHALVGDAGMVRATRREKLACARGQVRAQGRLTRLPLRGQDKTERKLRAYAGTSSEAKWTPIARRPTG